MTGRSSVDTGLDTVRLQSVTIFNRIHRSAGACACRKPILLGLFLVGFAFSASPLKGQGPDTLLYVGLDWPSVGSQLGDNYDEFFRSPVSQNVMTRQLYVRISRGAEETALVMLREAGFAVKGGAANPQPDELTPRTRYALRGRLVEFSLDTRGRTDRRVEVKLAIHWDVLALPRGNVVYSKELRSESEVRLDGDRFGSYFTATTQAYEEVFAELRLDEEFVALLTAGGFSP